MRCLYQFAKLPRIRKKTKVQPIFRDNMGLQFINFQATLLQGKAEADLNTTGTIIGTILLFIPYFFVIVPGLRDPIVNRLVKLYLHQTPRTEWNVSVDQYPPRRVIGFFCALITIGVPCLIIQYYHYKKTQDFWLDLFQIVVYISLPLCMSIVRPSAHSPCDIGDLLILILILVPLQLSDYDSFGNHKFLPDIKLEIHKSLPNISMLRITALNIGIVVYYIFRPLRDIGLGWDLFGRYLKIHWIILRWILAALFFCAIAVPISVGLKFIEHSHGVHGNIWIRGVLKVE